LPERDYSFFDSVFWFMDLLIQLLIVTITFCNILTKEGYADLTSPDTYFGEQLKMFGLNRNLCLVVIFATTHINQSKFIGLSTFDGFQYLLLRILPFAIHALAIWRSEYAGTMKFHFEQILLIVFYLSYLIFNDY